MARLVRIVGVDKVIRNMRRARGTIGRGFALGLMEGGLFLQRESQLVVPIDTGALKDSAFTRKKGEGVKTDVTVGYTQKYAVYVHENLEARHKEGKQAKYLEGPARRKKKEILAIIRSRAKMG